MMFLAQILVQIWGSSDCSKAKTAAKSCRPLIPDVLLKTFVDLHSNIAILIKTLK